MGVMTTQTNTKFEKEDEQLEYLNYCDYEPLVCSIGIVVFLVALIATIAAVVCLCIKKRHSENRESMHDSFRMSQELDNTKRENEELQQQMSQLTHQNKQYCMDKSKLEKELNAAKAQAEDDRKRANQLLNMRIAQNPDTQDLNDKSRPEIIVNEFKTLASNLRLDMLEAFESEDKSLEVLTKPAIVAMKCYELAQVYYEECQFKVCKMIDQMTVAKTQARGTAEQLKEATQLEIKQELKLRSAEAAVAVTVEQVLTDFELGDKPVAVEFVTECARLTWYMVLQAVPIRLLEATTGQPRDTKDFNLFPECASGDDKHVTCTVWPAVVSDGSTGGNKVSSQYSVLEKGLAFTTRRQTLV